MLPQQRRRYAVLAIAGVLHVVVIELILLPSEPPRKPRPKPRVSPPVPVTEQTVPVENTSISATPDQNGPGHAVDWMSELDQTSQDVAARQAAGSGPSPEASHTPQSWWPAPAHKAGEQYTLNTGQKIYWVSDHCFLVSDPPLAGTPNALAHSQLTHTECQKPPTPGGDLFKDLPAYKRYHSDAPDSGVAARP